MAKMKLRAPAQSYQTQKVVLAAALAGVELETSYGESAEALAALVPHGKSLVLEVPAASGVQPPLLLARSNVALRFLAENAPGAGLYGETVFEAGVADQWLDFCFNSFEVPAAVLRLQGQAGAPEVGVGNCFNRSIADQLLHRLASMRRVPAFRFDSGSNQPSYIMPKHPTHPFALHNR